MSSLPTGLPGPTYPSLERGLGGGTPRDKMLPHQAAPSPVLPGVLAVLWHLAPPGQWGALSQMDSHVGLWS